MFVGDDTLHDVVDTWSRARSAMEEARLPLSGAIIAERIRTDATEAEPMEQTGLLCWVIPSGCARRMGDERAHRADIRRRAGVDDYRDIGAGGAHDPHQAPASSSAWH